MRYSFLLSTLGRRETLTAAIANLKQFVDSRSDAELVVGTTKSDLDVAGGKTIHVHVRGEYFAWIDAFRASKGDVVILSADDVLFSQNLLERLDRLWRPEVVMIQPTLVDPEGYVIIGRYIPSYGIAAIRREMVDPLKFGTSRSCDSRFVDKIRRARPHQVLFDSESFALHLGYPIGGGVNSLLTDYMGKWERFSSWISSSRERNNHRRVDLAIFRGLEHYQRWDEPTAGIDSTPQASNVAVPYRLSDLVWNLSWSMPEGTLRFRDGLLALLRRRSELRRKRYATRE